MARQCGNTWVQAPGGTNVVFFVKAVKVDRESCYCAFLLRTNVIKIVLLLVLVYSPAFSFMF